MNLNAADSLLLVYIFLAIIGLAFAIIAFAATRKRSDHH